MADQWAEGQRLDAVRATLVSRVARGDWGEYWRARHDDAGDVFVLAYTTPKGCDAFDEVQRVLDPWNALAGSSHPELLAAVEWQPGTEAGGLLVVADPGGSTLREYVDEHGPLAPEEQCAMVLAVARASEEFTAAGHAPLGLSPDTVVRAPDGAWRLVPLAAGVIQGLGQFHQGAYAPKELRPGVDAAAVNPDVFALSWLWFESAAGEFGLPRQPRTIRERVEYKRLAVMIANGVEPVGGAYPNPKIIRAAVDRYRRKELAEDRREAEAARAAANRAPAAQFLYQYRQVFGKLALVAGALALGVLLVMAVARMFSIDYTTNSPIGTASLYLEAVVRGDTDEAAKYIEGGAVIGSDNLVRDIDRTVANGWSGPPVAAQRAVRGSGDTRTAKVSIEADGGFEMMVAEMTLRKGEDGRWIITEIFHENRAEPDERDN